MRSVPLQQICDIQIGKTPSRSVPEYWGGDLPWVTISDFAAGRTVTTTKEKITQIGAAESRSKRIPRGTLLLSFKLSLGKRTIAGCDLFTNEAIAALHILDHDAADRDYLYWALGSIDYDRIVDRAAKGKTLNKAKLKLLRIPLPPLAEQKRIAGILDAADALRAKRREALTQLDILLQSIFLDMFGDPVTNPMGWEVSRLADVVEFHAGSSLPSGEDFVGQDGGYLNLKVSDLNAPENTTRIVSSKLWSTDRGNGTIAPERATVFPKRGGAIGTNKKRLLDSAAILDPNLMAVSAGERLHHLFLYRWFFTFDLVDITSGSTVPQLNKRDLSPLPIQIPPIPLQRRFAAIVESVEQQKATQRTHLAELDTLFASLQSRAFQGDL